MLNQHDREGRPKFAELGLDVLDGAPHIQCQPFDDHRPEIDPEQIGASQIAIMKPTAYLINTARGGIVDEDALYDALSSGRIAGAALDCFAEEPITSPHRFGELENMILAPHSIAWTDELFRDIGRAAGQGMIDLSLGRQLRGTLNPQVFDQPRFIEKWRRHQHLG